MSDTITQEQFVLWSREGEKLRADISYVKTGEPKPVILFLHGFKGFKDWGPFPTVREYLARAGFVSIGFNFSHNGVGEDLQTFTELDRFSYNTFSLELQEIEDVLAILINTREVPIDVNEIIPDRVGLLGHSRGAALAILAGKRSKSVRAITAWAPVSKFDRYTDRQKERWRKDGFFDIMNMRTKQTMRLSVELLNDVENHRERLNILQAASDLPNLEKPLCVIAGSEDLTTPPTEAKAIADTAEGEFTELHILKQTGHTFGAEHPFNGITPALQSAMDVTTNFFKRSLIEHVIPILR